MFTHATHDACDVFYGSAAHLVDTTRTQLMAALRPLLVTGRVTHVLLRMKGLQLGAAEAAALGRVGGPHITCLTTASADVQGDFWASLLSHLPRLDTLVLARILGPLDGFTRPLELKPAEFATIGAFCSSAPRLGRGGSRSSSSTASCRAPPR
jgi:hypothetical protein